MKTVLITGGSEGIGLALAECFCQNGDQVILTGRKHDKLNEAAGRLAVYHTPVETVATDLAEKHGAEKLFERYKDRRIDILINNAGTGFTGYAWNQLPEESEQMIELNAASVLILSNLFAAKMKKEGSGTILNVSSTGAFQPGPYIAAYYASKSFVLSYTIALHEEMKNTNVQIYCLCPGPVKTGFYRKSGSKEPHFSLTAGQCAEYAYRHLNQRRCVMVPGLLNQIARLIPAGIKMKTLGVVKKRMIRNK